MLKRIPPLYGIAYSIYSHLSVFVDRENSTIYLSPPPHAKDYGAYGFTSVTVRKEHGAWLLTVIYCSPTAEGWSFSHAFVTLQDAIESLFHLVPRTAL